MDFKQLPNTPIYKSLSEMGKEIFLPNGIIYWATRAKKEADLNGSIGAAMGLESDIIDGGSERTVHFYLKDLKNFINIDPERFVSYAPMQGVTEFRKLWKDWIIYKGNTNSNLPSGNIDLTEKITEPLICSGITNAIFLVSRLFLNPGEKIIVPNKRWGNYNSILTKQNGILVESFQFFNLESNSYNNAAMMELIEKIGEEQGKVVLILNFPNNPTGYCPTQNEALEIVQSLKSYCDKTKGEVPVVIFCDDAYEGYVYTNSRIKQSIFYELVGIHPAIIPLKLDGTSKEMLMYGARVAAITLGLHEKWYSNNEEKTQLCAEWENKTKAMVRSTISNSPHFSQEILIDILNKGFDKFISDRKPVVDILKKRYEKTIECFNTFNPPNMTMDPSGGGFFIFINVKDCPADKLADHLLVKYKFGCIPIINEKEEINGIRVAYCSIPVEKIEESIKRIDLAIRDLI